MPSEYGSFSHRLGRWLEGFGFIDDPFALHEADQERCDLPYFFVDRPYLHGVLGNPSHPQTAFLMAGRGHGKTATREMVAYECIHSNLRGRALAVHYYDFSSLLEQVDSPLHQLTARHHVRAIARFIFKALVDDVPPTYFDNLEGIGRGLLMGYAAAFADPISHVKLGQIIREKPITLDWNSLSPRETLATLAEMVCQLGQSTDAKYQALYILVDRVDESAAGPKAAVPLLKPLVIEGPLLEMSHLAFKFFLPIEVGEQLRQAVNLRPDRLYMHTITWNRTALIEMVQQRLFHFSEGRVERLEELCTSGAKSSVMNRLIQASEGSPRTLLRLCQALIHHHVKCTNEALIEYKDVTNTLTELDQRLKVERLPVPEDESQRVTSRPNEPPESGLYLNDSGHVWIDGNPLTPPLSDLEFQLLQTLYHQSPEIVSNEALMEAVWPSAVYETDEQNLRKLITRLRSRLALEEPGNRTRFVKNARGRGYWLKTR